MKLVAFARTSLAPLNTAPSTLVYFERFEVHPIKVRHSVGGPELVSKLQGESVCHPFDTGRGLSQSEFASSSQARVIHHETGS